MNAVIVGEGGTLMQTAGDSVFAVFGAPLPLDDHPARAVRAALAMHASQTALNRRWSLEQKPVFGLGIAVTGGEVAAALLGSEDHVEYSIVGDVVNLAQRIQQWAHAGETILSKTTYDAVWRTYPEAQALQPAAVKGRETLVRGYRLGGR
jgi:class 3 adenylate cyclase